MFTNSLITLDVDWVSDPVIKSVADRLIKANVKATWFITHDSPETQNLFNHQELFEIGIHPNFSESSTQGDTPTKVMDYLKDIAPDAVSMRTHSLIQSSSLLRLAVDKYGILYDSSTLLQGTPFISPHKLYLVKNKPLIRIPYFFEDSAALYNPEINYKSRHISSGLQVYNFHPIHVELNTSNIDQYNLFKARNNSCACTLSDVYSYSNKQGPGTRTLFNTAINEIKQSKANKSYTISEIGALWSNIYGH